MNRPSPTDPSPDIAEQRARRHRNLLIALTVVLILVPLVLGGLRLAGRI